MGNSSAERSLPSPSFSEIRRIQHQLFSHLTEVEQQATSKLFLVKQLTFGNQMEFQKTSKKIAQRKILTGKKAGKYVIQLKDFNVLQTSEVCGKSFKIFLYLQHFSQDLRGLFLERKKQRKHFSEQEVTAFLQSITNCLITLNDCNLKNFHIYKESVIITDDETYKLVDTQLTSKISPYFEVLNGIPPKQGTYLAPELLIDIRNNNSQFYGSPKADIFTLGMIALELLTLQDYDRCYDYEKKVMAISQIRQKVQGLLMSEHLRKVLLKMLQPEQQQRLGLISLKQILTPGAVLFSEGSWTQYSPSQIFDPKSQNICKHVNGLVNGNEINRLSAEKSRKNHQIAFGSHKKQSFQARPQTKTLSNKPQFSEPPFIKLSEGLPKSCKQSDDLITRQQLKLQVPKCINSVNTNSFHRLQFYKKESKLTQQSPEGRLDVRRHAMQPDTPVNCLQPAQWPTSVQPSANNTPIRKIELLSKKLADQSVTGANTFGKHSFSNGATYQGQFNPSNQFQGNGMLFYPNGSLCYSGTWKKNTFNGFGVLNNANPAKQPHFVVTNYENFTNNPSDSWIKYEGEFALDKKEGFGTLFFRNNDKFSGCFRQDLVQGFGSFYLASQGKHISGIWAHNELKR